MSIRVRLRVASLSALVLFACQTMPEAPCADSFSVKPRRAKHSVEFFATNSCHVSIFMELSFPELRNLAPSESLPVRESLPPHSRREVLVLKPIDPYKGWAYESSVAMFYGNETPDPNRDYLYSFPFEGSQTRLLSQGVGGESTHQGVLHYAFDFVMPIGTPVLAARDGIVLSVTDGFPAGGFHEKYTNRANAVNILHADGTIGSYAHFSAGIPAQEGTRVEVGDFLGFSGNSGYSEGPHLHFHVSVQRQGAELPSIPIRFRGGIVPVEGRYYGQ